MSATHPMRTQPVLSAGIRSFTYHGDEASVLEGIDLNLAPGTFTAILGASGSGKSTLGRLLSGWLPPGTGGTLRGFLELAGTRLDFGGDTDPRINPAEWGRQVGFVPQDPAAVLSTVRATVAEELAFGLENAALERRAMKATVEHTAGLLGLSELLGRNPAALSGGQLRRLAIGCAIITGPRVLIMDEPFASLDSAGTAELARLLQDLATAGTAVVVLSQVVDAPLLDAGTWVLLADGSVMGSGTPAEMGAGPGLLPSGIRYAGGGTAPGQGHKEAVQTETLPPRNDGGVPALELRGVSFGYSARGKEAQLRNMRRRDLGGKAAGSALVLQGINLRIHSGEIVAVTGPNGAGKSTLLRHFNGLLRPTAGRVLVHGRDIAGVPPGEAAGSVGLLFQQPRDQLFERTALREVRFGLDRLFHPGEAASRALEALSAVGLAGAEHTHPAELPASGQRLLALATVLARKPSVLALDEPTVGLDGGGLALLDAAVRSAAGEGAAVVLVTHDLCYARAAAHRVVALDGGRLEG
ncbi:energy-coupling factor ABC transporter ATP-binding protein [Arthrobacter sp. AK04]|uniref:ABC transporter ATP-binding protein n=1 Tax=Arthrobacter sp. AK04 TaxID=2900048 RepID=UPI001E424627|nr:ABC transporter ATP-binding protein [Arthrobacter sp. AK04]MCD5341922.1 energy-coupling factor ABC transporter ATP-binding protein [Arthrobacter sp. AK04]